MFKVRAFMNSQFIWNSSSCDLACLACTYIEGCPCIFGDFCSPTFTQPAAPSMLHLGYPPTTSYSPSYLSKADRWPALLLAAILFSCSESWVADLKKAVGESKGSAAQQSSGKVVSSLDDLGKAFSGKDIEKAKTSFENAVAALSAWVSDAGIAQQIKGL